MRVGGLILSGRTMTDLLGRESELAEIEQFVRRGGVMSIEAGAGVGKTSMLTDLRIAVAQRLINRMSHHSDQSNAAELGPRQLIRHAPNRRRRTVSRRILR